MLDNEGGTHGILIIPIERTLTTEEDFKISDGTYPDRSKLTFNGGGTLIVGGGLTIEALLETSGHCKIEVGTFYKHVSGKVSFAGNIELDISTSGALPSDVEEHNFYISKQAEYEFGTGTVDLLIDIFNGHLGTKEEIYLEKFTITNNSKGGTSIFEITNNTPADTEFFMKVDEGIGDLTIDINKGTTLTFDHVTTSPKQPVYFRNLNVISGEFILSNDSWLEITDTPPANTF